MKAAFGEAMATGFITPDRKEPCRKLHIKGVGAKEGAVLHIDDEYGFQDLAHELEKM